MANRITTIFEGDATKLKNALKDVGKAMGEAHGFTATLKAGVKGTISAFKDFAKTPAGIAATTTAVAAAGAAAFEAADKWAQLGIKVDDFAKAAGISDEAASRWVEVSGDLGVSAEDVEKSIGFMNKTLGKTPALFDQLGVTVAKTSSGAIDANGTFLNVIQRLKDIKDPAAQAAVGTQLLGRSWQNMAEFIGQGSTELAKRLQEVEKQKIFDEAKVAKAKQFRDTMDNLGDSFQDLVLELGEKVLPLIENLAEGITTVVHAVDSVVSGVSAVTTGIGKALTVGRGADKLLDDFIKKQDKINEGTTETDRETRRLAGAMGELDPAMASVTDQTEMFNGAAVTAQNTMQGYSYAAQDAKDTTKRLADEQEEAKRKSDAYAQSLEDQRNQLKDLLATQRSAVDGEVGYRQAQEDTMLSIDAYNKTLADHKSKQEDVKAAQDTATQAIIDQSEKYATLNGAALDSSGGIARQIQSLKDQEASLAPDSPLRAYLDWYISKLQDVTYWAQQASAMNVTGAIRTPEGDLIGGPRNGGPRASGGPVQPGEMYTVGEHGPETLVMGSQSGTIVPNEQQRADGGGQTIVYATINMPMGSNGNDVVKALKNWERRNGPGWRS